MRGRSPRCRLSDPGTPRRSARLGRRSSTGESDASTVASTPQPSATRTVPSVQDLLGADRERGDQICRDPVQERVREENPEHHTGGRGEHPEDERLKGEQDEDLAPVIALHAQIGHEAPPLGDGQQHRVQGEQESDHHARSLRTARSTGCLAWPPGRAGAARCRRAPRPASVRQPAQLARPRAVGTRPRLEQTCETFPEAVSRWATRSWVRATGLEARAPNSELLRIGAHSDRLRAPRARTLTWAPAWAPVDRGHARRQDESAREGESARAELARAEAAERVTAGVTPSICTASRPRGPTTVMFSRSTPAPTRTPGKRLLVVSRLCPNPSDDRAESCRRAEPTT